MTEKKNTLILKPTKEDIQTAAKIIRQGGLVAFPTETVYGLGADAMNADAVGRIYEAKGRPSDNPMIVHISRASDIGQLTPMLSPPGSGRHRGHRITIGSSTVERYLRMRLLAK